MNTENESHKQLSKEQWDDLLKTLKERFEKNKHRHKSVKWEDVAQRLEEKSEKLWSLLEMERTGGEPDVVGFDETSGELIFYDCSPETPSERRNICYDHEALSARKKFPPEDSAMNMAQTMGIELLTEEQYFQLQKLGEFDLKTSSWLMTPKEVRKHGGAIFGDRRYGRVFIYHNGADSYYGVRGFRGSLRV